VKEPRAVKEIHDIRLKLYHKWKNLSDEEMINAIKTSSRKAEIELKKLLRKNRKT
jgi:hypothetical protein